MRWIVVGAALALSGCAGVSFNQLDPTTLANKTGAPEGAVYYLPKPVLLVAVAPQTPDAKGTDDGEGHLGAPAAPAPAAPAPGAHHKPAPVAPPPVPGPVGGIGGAAAPAAKDDSKKDTAAADPSPAPAASSDQSFSIAVPGYTLKVIYIPDRAHPMRMSVHAGFGTASLKPTLQNGWMLTGFDSQADSKTAELLASVAQMVTAAKGPAAKAASTAASAAGGSVGAPSPPDTGILRPGLYDFEYSANGKLVGLCALTYFASTGPVPATDCK